MREPAMPSREIVHRLRRFCCGGDRNEREYIRVDEFYGSFAQFGAT